MKGSGAHGVKVLGVEAIEKGEPPNILEQANNEKTVIRPES